jgi:hypothetical protein
MVTFYSASGYRLATTGAFTATGSIGYAWSCASSGVYVFFLDFTSSSVRPAPNNGSRSSGLNVRCVQNLLVLFKLCCYSHWVEVDLVCIGVVTSYPATGYRNYASGAFLVTGSNGCCWSCALTDTDCYFLFFGNASVSPMSLNGRSHGFPVRCVQNLLTCLVL